MPKHSISFYFDNVRVEKVESLVF